MTISWQWEIDELKRERDEWKRQAEALAAEDDGALTFLRLLVKKRGAIVSSADCDSMELTIARASGRFYVDPQGYGYVLKSEYWRNVGQKANDARTVIAEQSHE